MKTGGSLWICIDDGVASWVDTLIIFYEKAFYTLLFLEQCMNACDEFVFCSNVKSGISESVFYCDGIRGIFNYELSGYPVRGSD